MGTMYEIMRLKSQFRKLLKQLGYKTETAHTDWNVIAAVLLAGLYPNVVNVDESGLRPVLYDHTQRVYIHPSSITHNETKFPTQWIGYHMKVQTSQVFIRSTCLVSSVALLLFGGQFDVDIEKGIVTIDKWIELRTTGRVAVLYRELRHELN